MTYQQNINRGLSRTYKKAPIYSSDPGSLKMIIFSDHHKGQRDKADDFEACEPAYLEAIKHYEQSGYTLTVLGDAEELWENQPNQVIPCYAEVTSVERKFNQSGRYVRIFGNHDDEWCYPDSVQKQLVPELGPLPVYEGLRINIVDGQGLQSEIFLVHGHQGTLVGDRLSWITRRFVRHIWRPIQRVTNVRLTTPATNWRLRQRHEVAMYNWAIARSGILLIAGHTHHPIFPSHALLAQLMDRYQELRRSPEGLGDSQLEALEADIAYARRQTQPCYFNTGCCSFADGSITGIELFENEIKLVRWTTSPRGIRRKMLDKASLLEIMARIQEPAEPMNE